MTKQQSIEIPVYQMKVRLTDIEPPIWRRFLVTGDQTLYRLHLILQTIMGWENYHLYDFTISEIEYGEPDEEYLLYAEANKAASTFYTDKCRIQVHLLPYFGNTLISRITPQMLDTYKQMRVPTKRSIEPRIVRCTITTLCSMPSAPA